eukprot:gene4499-3216_t
MEQALPVEYVPFDETVELTGDVSEMSVEQYLSWVRTQSSRLPTVFRAENVSSSTAPSHDQTKYMPEVESIPTCPESHLPSDEWERNILSTFSELRLSLAAKSAITSAARTIAVPSMKDRAGWIAFCLNIDLSLSQDVIQQDLAVAFAGDSEDADISIKKRKRELAENLGIAMDAEDGEVPENDAPEASMDVVEEPDVDGELDQVLTQRILLYLIDFVEEHGLRSTVSEWIYALLTRVEKPLHRDVVAALRQLFRRCCKLRAELIEDNNETFSETLASLNLLIAITGNYFGQNEALQSYFSDRKLDEGDNDGGDDMQDDDDAEADEDVNEMLGYDGDRPSKLTRLL